MRENKIKVLQVNKFYHPVIGGVERVVQQVAEGLNDRVSMKVLACQKKGPSIVEKINNIEVVKSGSIGTFFSMPVSFSFFFDFFEQSKDADIVHIHLPFPLADLALWFSGYKGKVVLWWHSDIVKQKKIMFFYRPLMTWLLKRSDLIIAATEGHIKHSEYLPRYADKCVVIPYAVDKCFSEILPIDRFDMTNNSSSLCSILYVGRLVYYKGCDVLISAMKEVNNAELIIVGEGPLRNDLEKLSVKLGLAYRVHFTGKLSDEKLSEAFSLCDVFVLPSVAKSEAFGLVQIEAMSYGKPVINTCLESGVPFVSLDGITGITVPPSDPVELASAIQKLVDNPDLRQKYGKAAFSRVREKFSMDKMLSDVYNEYVKIIDTE